MLFCNNILIHHNIIVEHTVLKDSFNEAVNAPKQKICFCNIGK